MKSPVYLLTVLRIRIRDPGSGAFLTPGSGIGIRNRFFPDPGSRIPDPGFQNHIFESLMTIFCIKSSIILWKLAHIFFFSNSNTKWFSVLWYLWLQNKVWQQFFFHPSLLLLLQHCLLRFIFDGQWVIYSRLCPTWFQLGSYLESSPYGAS